MSNKKPYPIRLDHKKLEALKEMGLSPSQFIRGQIDEMISKRVCPTCGQKVTKEK